MRLFTLSISYSIVKYVFLHFGSGHLRDVYERSWIRYSWMGVVLLSETFLHPFTLVIRKYLLHVRLFFNILFGTKQVSIYFLWVIIYIYLHRRPGLIDIITSFPILIIMIWMKVTGNVSSWIVKLPAFRIYILLPFHRVLLHSTSRDSFIPHVATPRNPSNSQRVCGSSHLLTPQIIHSIPLFLMYHTLSPTLFSHSQRCFRLSSTASGLHKVWNSTWSPACPAPFFPFIS